MSVKKFSSLTVMIFSGFLPDVKITLKASTKARLVFDLTGTIHAYFEDTHLYKPASSGNRRYTALTIARLPNRVAILHQYHQQ